jgi:hypothetical protein
MVATGLFAAVTCGARAASATNRNIGVRTGFTVVLPKELFELFGRQAKEKSLPVHGREIGFW